jgi:hypothetical protein
MRDFHWSGGIVENSAGISQAKTVGRCYITGVGKKFTDKRNKGMREKSQAFNIAVARSLRHRVIRNEAREEGRAV